MKVTKRQSAEGSSDQICERVFKAQSAYGTLKKEYYILAIGCNITILISRKKEYCKEKTKLSPVFTPNDSVKNAFKSM